MLRNNHPENSFLGRIAKDLNDLPKKPPDQLEVGNTLRDWERDINIPDMFLYLDGQCANEELFGKIPLTEADIDSVLSKLHLVAPEIRDYIKQAANQAGFSQVSQVKSMQDSMRIDYKLDLGKRRYDFIQNADGSVTFIESYYINDVAGIQESFHKLDSLNSADGVVQNNNNDPAAYISMSSIIRFEKETITHELADDHVLLMKKDKCEKLSFLFEDRNKQKRYGKTVKEIDDENKNKVDFLVACQELAKTTQSDAPTKLQKAGKKVLNKAHEVYQKNMLTPDELPLLTRYVLSTNTVVKNPSRKNISNYAKDTKILSQINRPWAKIMAGALLGFLGVALVAASITVGVLSLGTGAPLVVGGLVLAHSVLHAGLALGVLAPVSALVSTGAGLFVRKNNKNSIATAGENVESIAKKL